MVKRLCAGVKKLFMNFMPATLNSLCRSLRLDGVYGGGGGAASGEAVVHDDDSSVLDRGQGPAAVGLNATLQLRRLTPAEEGEKWEGIDDRRPDDGTTACLRSLVVVC